MNNKILAILSVLLVTTIISITPALAATQNAVYNSHTGNIYPTGGTIVEAVATPDDGKFIQMDVGSAIILKFPGDYLAMPDGTANADLQVNIYDVPYPAYAEVFVSLDGISWTSVGIYPDTADIDLDIEGTGPVKYVKIDQNGYEIDPAYPNLGFDLDAVIALNAVGRIAEITSPTTGDTVCGLVSFEAYLIDDDYDPVQWAVRKGTCAAATNTVFGNVDGYSNPFSWAYNADTWRYEFSATADTSSWVDGSYCFIFNPSEDSGESDIRLTDVFVIGDLDEDGICDDADNCPSISNAGQEDCNDNGIGDLCDSINPEATEVCDGVDNNCDGTTDDVADIITDVSGYDNIGECQVQIESCIDGNFQITQEAIGPSEETCDTLDNDCDGEVDTHACNWYCVSTVEYTPTLQLGVNRHVWTGDFENHFTTLISKKMKGRENFDEISSTFSIEDTNGCSCSQILTQLNEYNPEMYGEMLGHWKYGCSKSVMQEFIRLVVPEVKVYKETVTVPANDADGVESLTILEFGKDYELKAYGTATACWSGSCHIEFDAEYSTSDFGVTWVDGVAAPYAGYGTELLDLKVNDAFVNWGTYNSAHEYWLTITGTGVSLSLKVYDLAGSYGNDAGNLYVEIYQVI